MNASENLFSLPSKMSEPLAQWSKARCGVIDLSSGSGSAMHLKVHGHDMKMTAVLTSMWYK
jgi:hypothetical protein